MLPVTLVAPGGGELSPPWPMQGPPLPQPRGPLSEALLDVLVGPLATTRFPHARAEDPIRDEDEALSLYLCYELCYQGLAGVDDEWEWEPSLIGFRRELEQNLVRQLRSAVPRSRSAGALIAARIEEALGADLAPSVSRYLEQEGTKSQFLEFAIHRSAYQLKEADPHSWAIPRLRGQPKAAIVKIQYEEYGEGEIGRMHSTLFAETMTELDLDATYGAYLDVIPGATLSAVNLISLFGLNRRWRGALVGHLAGFEMTSVGPNARYAAAARRLGLEERAIRFFDVHVDADEEHQVLASTALAGGLALVEPHLADDIVFGAQCLCLVEGAWARHVIDAWVRNESSLRAVA
ncbi:MAG: iron-containing redox enzyme family protein [Acidimicrobiales bacterium]